MWPRLLSGERTAGGTRVTLDDGSFIHGCRLPIRLSMKTAPCPHRAASRRHPPRPTRRVGTAVPTAVVSSLCSPFPEERWRDVETRPIQQRTSRATSGTSLVRTPRTATARQPELRLVPPATTHSRSPPTSYRCVTPMMDSTRPTELGARPRTARRPPRFAVTHAPGTPQYGRPTQPSHGPDMGSRQRVPAAHREPTPTHDTTESRRSGSTHGHLQRFKEKAHGFSPVSYP